MRKFLFRSSLNLHWAVLLCIILYLPIFFFSIRINNIYISLTLIIIILYIILASTINYVEIHENHLKIVYPARIIKREIFIGLKEIKLVRDINYTHAYEYPRVQISKRLNANKIFSPKDTFPVYRFKKRKEILNYFNSNGIKIEIFSDKPKELEILN